MKNKTKTFPALLLLSFNAIIALIILIVAVSSPVSNASSLEAKNYMFFRYFTSDSNILSMISSFIMVYFIIRNMIKKEDKYPRWAIVLHYLASIHTGVTMFTTIFFLTPLNMALGNPVNSLFNGYLFFYHFFSPLIYIISVIYFFPIYRINLKENLLSLLPLTAYSIIYFSMVVTSHWPDFYGFTLGGNYLLSPISIIAMHSLGFLIGFIIRKMHNKRAI